MARKTRQPAELSRLHVLAASDERAFAAYASELLASRDRLARDAALDALVERPLPAARDALRALFLQLAPEGPKADQGAMQRVRIVRILHEIGDTRDADIAVLAADSYEKTFGDDSSWELRAQGLMLVARAAPALFPYYAVEHLDDNTGIDGEPAHTAFRLLAATENFVPVYQWLVAAHDSPHLALVFDLFAQAPQPIVRRFIDRTLDEAAARGNETLCTVLAETIVNLDLEETYPALQRLMSAKMSDELYGYLAVLLAATNRPPLLALLDEQLHRGRRPKLVEAALRVRTTPEQEAILRRWEQGD